MIEVKQTKSVETRARQSLGSSSTPVYQMVAKAIAQQHPGGGVLVDVGCGAGNLWSYVKDKCDRYIGIDTLQYDGFPETAEFLPLNLETGYISLPDASADVVCAIETIEHLENPRQLVRELVRLVKPGGWAIVTTPNQLSLLSKLTLVSKNQFNAFQESPGLYPAHITALLEIDLIRIFQECGLTQVDTTFTNCGRIPFTSWHWPPNLGFRGRAFSDNILCMGLQPKS